MPDLLSTLGAPGALQRAEAGNAVRALQPQVADVKPLSFFYLVKLKLPFRGVCCRDKELAAVKVTAADVEIIMSELEVDRKQAERRLREHQGSVKAALQSFLTV